MRHLDRWLAGVAALAVLLGTHFWLGGFLRGEPLARYSFEWLVKLTPGEHWFYGAYLFAGTLATALGAWALVPVVRAALAGGAPRWRPRSTHLLVLLAILASAAAAGLGWGVLRNQVVTDDEYVYLFQSRLLLEGGASAPAPAMPEFFTNAFVDTRNGRWFGQYPPGHPLALAPAVWMGVPRLSPILLAGMNVLLTGLLVARSVGGAWGIVGAMVLLVSPLFLLTGSTLLSHSTTYFGLVTAALGAAHVARTGSAAAGLATGVGIGIAFLARPWTGVTLGLFPAAWLLWGARHRGTRSPWILGGLALALAVMVMLLYNRGQTGDFFVTGYQAQRRSGGMIEFGFGTILPGRHEHTPWQGVANAVRLAWRFLSWSWPWAVFAGIAVGALRRRAWKSLPSMEGQLPLRTLTAGAALMLLLGFVSYVPYWSIGVGDTGPVKTYEGLLPFAMLTVLGVRHWSARRGVVAPVAWGLASLATAGALFWPIALDHVSDVAARVRTPYVAVEAAVTPPALVFMSTPPGMASGSWVFGRPNPRPDLSDPVLFVRDLGPANPTLARLHPNRTAYVMEWTAGTPRLRPLRPGAGGRQ